MVKLSLILAAALLPSLAQAHVGIGAPQGFSHGFAHPFLGLDHVLAMVAVGVLAAQLGGRALWLVPVSFVGMMVVGGGLGMAGVALPLVEVGIGLSVAVLGLMIASGFRLPVAAAAAVAGAFAVFHGYAHGAEMPESASGVGYGFGFVLATAGLHALGIGLGLLVAGIGGRSYGRPVIRLAGTLTCLAGAVMLAGAV